MSWPSVSPGAGASESRWADILGPDDAVRRTTSGRLLKGSGNEIFLRHLIHLGSLQTENISQRWSLRDPPRWRWILSRLLWDSRPIKCCYCCSNKEKIRKKNNKQTQREFSSCLLQWLFLVDDRRWGHFLYVPLLVLLSTSNCGAAHHIVLWWRTWPTWRVSSWILFIE